MENTNTSQEYSQEFIVHFDVPNHRLTIEEFYQSAKNIQTITDSLNQVLFESKPVIGVYVRPPDAKACARGSGRYCQRKASI